MSVSVRWPLTKFKKKNIIECSASDRLSATKHGQGPTQGAAESFSTMLKLNPCLLNHCD